jgi:Kef-type K+ transport system membrane component KefB
MARTITVSGQTVKVRHPLAPLGLGIITFGIYTLVWYYLINDEMRRQGEDVSPGISLLAVTLGALLIIPPFVSMYNTAERIRRAQEIRGVSGPISPVLALVLLFVPIANIFQTAYLQSGLNRAWERGAGDFGALPAASTSGGDQHPDDARGLRGAAG